MKTNQNKSRRRKRGVLRTRGNQRINYNELGREKLEQAYARGKGRHKHQDKIDGVSGLYIYMSVTKRQYIRHWRRFCLFLARIHARYKSFEELLLYLELYVQYMIEEGYSAWTIKSNVSAIAKIIPGAAGYVHTPARRADDIHRSRRHGTAAYVGKMGKRYPHLILFCVCVGLRKYKELRFVRGSHLTKLRKGGYGICVPKGKGGRKRVARIIGTEEETAIIVEMCRKAGEELLFPKLPSGLDVHALRALYAGRAYWDYVRHHPETKETYAFRSVRTGLVCDRNAMRFTSRQLGHNRISVIAASYLWTLEATKSLDLRALVAAVRPMHGSGPAETAIMEWSAE